MKKVSTLTREQYAALKKHLVLITAEEYFLPEDDAEFRAEREQSFPCYRFVPGKLAEKDDSIEPAVLLGRRNPWNCAQLIAAMMPQVLDYLSGRTGAR